MKMLISIVLALSISSCQWIATHPAEDIEIIEIGEMAIEELYEYETRTLSPTPPFLGPVAPTNIIPIN